MTEYSQHITPQSLKAFAFMIILKRKYRASVLLKGKNRKNAEIFGMSVNTYKFYIDLAIREGYITEEPTCYRAASFFTIIKHFCKKHNLKLHNHGLLKKKKLKFKTVLFELEQQLFHDSGLLPKAKWVLHQEKTKPQNVIKKASAKANFVAEVSPKDEAIVVRSSIRQISKLLHVGHQKASKILNAKNHLYRAERDFCYEKLRDGYTMDSMFDMLIETRPGAHILPLIEFNSFKVSYATKMYLNPLRMSYRCFGKKVGKTEMMLMAERLERVDVFVEDNRKRKKLFKTILNKEWKALNEASFFLAPRQSFAK